jgi:hypothetical protein
MADVAPQTPPAASAQPAPTADPSSTPPATEAKTTEGKSLAEETPSILNEGAPPPKEELPPSEYSEFKVPEGYQLDPDISKEASTLFKGMKLNQKNAQSLVDFYVSKTQEAFNAPFNAYREMTEGWLKEIKADPEIGSKLDQVKSTVASAIDSLGDPKLASDFRRAMDLTGAGNNPAFVRTFYKLAQMVTEGKSVAGTGPSPHGQSEQGTGSRPSAAHALYPKLP